MKTPFRLIPIFCAASALLLIVSPAAQAGYIVTLQEVGPDVVATGSGPIDLTGLTLLSLVAPAAGILASSGVINTGESGVEVPGYTGFTGPTSFGSGGLHLPNSSNGDFVGINTLILKDIFVPAGYVSDTALSDSATYSGQTFATLGVTPGTYVWMWGTGANQNFTLQIGPTGVPDSGSTFGLFFVGLLGLVGASRLGSLGLA